MKAIVITTINEKTDAVMSFEKFDDWHIVLVGDRKSKAIESTDNLTFLSVRDQMKLGYEVMEMCPYNHYSRKNIGYLYALSHGADEIYETDDDNLPYGDWSFPDTVCDRVIDTEDTFFNVYSYFTREHIWPRGYPLEKILVRNRAKFTGERKRIGIWQGLADENPDVDAIYRLVLNKNLNFERKEPIALGKFVFCPFNSQNTLWTREMIPYAYLPSTVSFRFTDILRGYIAQRMLWEHDLHLGFTAPQVYQMRNAHNLMRDFEDEVGCYSQVTRVVEALGDGSYSTDFQGNLISAYTELKKMGVVHKSELKILSAWDQDLESLM